MCLGVVFFVFVLLGFHSKSGMCVLMSFIRFGKFSASISSDTALPHFLFSFWDCEPQYLLTQHQDDCF